MSYKLTGSTEVNTSVCRRRLLQIWLLHLADQYPAQAQQASILKACWLQTQYPNQLANNLLLLANSILLSDSAYENAECMALTQPISSFSVQLLLNILWQRSHDG